MKIYNIAQFKQYNALSNVHSRKDKTSVNNFDISFRGSLSSYFYADSLNLYNNYCKNLLQQITPEDAKTCLDFPKIGKSTLRYIASNELQKMLKYKKDKLLYIITGRPGSGKTTLVRKLKLNNDFYTPDADDIKPLLPYYNENGATYVHIASCVINYDNFKEAIKRGINTVIQTATTFKYLDEFIIRIAKSNNYKIKLIYINVDENTAIKRCAKRELARGRGIPIEAIVQKRYLDDLVSVYSSPEKGLDEIIVYNSNNEKMPALVKHIDISGKALKDSSPIYRA